MRFTHRALAALLALALCLVGGAVPEPLFAVPAIAEQEAPGLEIAAAASPDEYVIPGEAQLSFTLTNPTDGLLEGVCLTSPDGMLVEPIGDMPAGAAQTYTRVHPLTQSELDAGEIRYIITCVSGSDHFSYPVSIPVRKVFADPEVEFLRQVSSRYCPGDGSVTVIYRLRNAGNVPVTAISVTDPLGSFDGRLELLDVGKTKVFVQHVSVSEASDSLPVLSYSSGAGPDVYTIALDALTIEPAHSLLNVSLMAGRSMFSSDTAEVILQLENGGNVDYLDLTVYDDVYGGVIADSVSLPAGGEPVEVARSYPLRGDSDYRWRITGRTSAGERIDLITDTESVRMDDDGGNPLLTLRVSTSMPHISRSGHIPLRLEIGNIGEAMATNVRIVEESSTEAMELAVIPLGEPTVCEIQREIRESTTLAFSAVYTDSFGRERIAAAEPVEITIGPGGQRPEGIRNRMIFDGIATQIPNSGLFMGLLIGSCAVLAALIVVLIITSRRARMRRKARKQLIKEEMGKTNRFKPIRARKEKKQTAKK